MSDDIGKLADEVIGRMKTTKELKTVPFEMYARVLDRAVKAEAERDALKALVERIANGPELARAALAPSPAGREG